MTNKELNYRGVTIKMKYCPDTRYTDAGWCWECFKDGVCIAELDDDYPYPEERALAQAKETIDTFVEAPEDDED